MYGNLNMPCAPSWVAQMELLGTISFYMLRLCALDLDLQFHVHQIQFLDHSFKHESLYRFWGFHYNNCLHLGGWHRSNVHIHRWVGFMSHMLSILSLLGFIQMWLKMGEVIMGCNVRRDLTTLFGWIWASPPLRRENVCLTFLCLLFFFLVRLI